MKAAELRDKTVDELEESERDLAEQLFALRLQKVTGQLDNPVKMRTVRRDLARVMTVLREVAAQAESGD
jgi:large subunit ribosomal protein L29